MLIICLLLYFSIFQCRERIKYGPYDLPWCVATGLHRGVSESNEPERRILHAKVSTPLGESSESPFRGRSRDLYALAKYLGLDQLQSDLERKGWDIGPQILSSDNTGVVCKFVRHKEFRFILDKETRETVWFSLHGVQTTKDSSAPKLGVGQECVYDLQITRKGKRPNSTRAANVRTLEGDIMI